MIDTQTAVLDNPLTDKKIDIENPDVRNALELMIKVELIKRYGREGNVLAWAKLLFPHKFYLPFCPELHNYLIETMREPFTSTEAPRGFAKTSLQCFLVPLYLAMCHPGEYRHFLNIQATSAKAVNENISIKSEIEYNKLLIEAYGYQVADVKWTEKQFVLRNGTIFSAAGVGESIRGLNYKNVRPDFIMADDLYDEDDIYSADSIRKKEYWFFGSLYPALDRTKSNSMHLQGTAIHKNDLLAKIRSDKKVVTYENKTISVKSRTFRAYDLITKQVLWPEYMSMDKLESEKELMGSVIFNREYQNERRNDETSIIKEQWIKYHDVIPEGSIIRAKICPCDPSIGEKEGNDYTGIVALYATDIPGTSNYNYWVEEVVNEHLSLNQRVLKLDNMNERHQFTKAPLEGIAGFRDFVAEVKRRTSLPVITIDSVKNKIANLERESAKFESGRVSINRHIPQSLRNKLVEQLINNYPANDDLRDALLLGLNTKLSGRITVETM